MMFEFGLTNNVHHQVAAINEKYADLRKGKNRQQIIALEEQRKEELCRLNPKYGKGGTMTE